MNSLLKGAVFSVVFALVGCSSSENKFVGKWKMTGSRSDEVAIIEKKKSGFDMYSEKTPERYITFTYDEERKQLTSNSMGGTMDIKFTTDEDHIELAPRKAELYSSPQRFERLED
jgi:hypothetical protein